MSMQVTRVREPLWRQPFSSLITPPAQAALSIMHQPAPGPCIAPNLPTPQVGNARFATGHFLEAAFLFKLMVTSTELEDFLTLKVGGCRTE